MRTLEVEFSEEDKSKLLNEICAMAEKEEQCHKKNGHKFIIKFNDELSIFAKVLMSDSFWGSPIRHVSTDIKVITVEGFYSVKSNLDYQFEDSINKALINEFHKNN